MTPTAANYLRTKDDGFPCEQGGRIYKDAYDLIGVEIHQAPMKPLIQLSEQTSIDEFRDSHPAWQSRNTGRWGYETIGGCADLRHDDYRSKLAAIRARNREARLAFGPNGYALTNPDGSPKQLARP